MIRISKPDRLFKARIELPSSKSISNRLLILQYYYNNAFRIENLSRSEDTVLLSSILDLLKKYRSDGETGLLRIDAKNAGTVLRFLVPLLCITRGHFLLTGSARMKQRPVAGLVEALRETGAEIEYVETVGYPPLLIRGRHVQGGRLRLDASLSSQFITALLLIAPTLDDGLTIELTREPVSWPYVKMTAGLLTLMGIQVIIQRDSLRVFPSRTVKPMVRVEADWSGASFWYMMLAVASAGTVILPGLVKSDLQGDQYVAALFSELGVETVELEDGIMLTESTRKTSEFFADFTDYPDIALPLIMTCAMLEIPASFRGLERLRLKESDRIEAVSLGLSQAGVSLTEDYPGLWKLQGRPGEPDEITIDNFGDHRVAMAFTALALKGFTVNMAQPEVVNKSYPGFWKDLENAGFKIESPC